MQRRDFLAGTAALPFVGLPFRGALRRRPRFELALETVLNEKIRAKKVIIPVGALQEVANYNGKVAKVSDLVYDEVEPELPWWRATLEWLIEFVRENWDDILAFLVKIVPVFLLLL